MDNKKFLGKLNFVPKENSAGVFIKKYPQAGNYAIEVNFEKEHINYGDKIKAESKTTQNFSQSENFVVLECVNRLLEKGYQPKNIVLEKTWDSGHGTSGRLDICVTHDNGSEYLLIECKTHGKEFDKEFARMKKDGGQLFTYFKFSNKADVIMLYASELEGKEITYRNEIVKIEDDYRIGEKKDFYEKWNKLTKDNGVFETWVTPYNFESKALTPKQLVPIKQEDSSLIFNQFLEILRHNVVSDKPNAFNKIFTLFLCKVYDEKTTKPNEELKFQWLDGIDKTTGENAYVDFLIRLSDLYKKGMLEFLEKEVTDFSENEFNQKYGTLDDSIKKDLLKEFNKIRLEKNNEFAIKEVFDNQSFLENSKIVKEVVELLQKFRLRYNKRQQYLSDFFEMLLTTGLKQESGQYFTPVPIAQFIIKSLPIDRFVDEKLEKGEKNNLLPYLIDYAAGSGHFLTEGMHEIQALINNKNPEKYISDTAKKIQGWHTDHFDWATQYIYGIEKDYRLVKVGKVGCYLHGDGLANVILSDGLASFNHSEYKGKLHNKDEDFPKENKQFDILVSNPPYSIQAFRNVAKDYYTEKDFELYDNLTDNSSEIECLFVERTKQLLKDGGVAGIILPKSILSSTGLYAKTRSIILQSFEIIAIAELDSNTFMATTTKTAVLFLRRRNNYDSINLKKSIDKFFNDWQDVAHMGIEKPISKYVNYVFGNISFEDYISLLKKEPNSTIANHEIYKEYGKKIKAKTEKEFWDVLIETEKEKLFYFILIYMQKIVWVKTGEKDTEKRFLGYEFSDRRGHEGIHAIQRDRTIAECTKLFDDDTFDNPEKASSYIYKAFSGDYDFPVHKNLKDNIKTYKTVELFNFKTTKFEHIIEEPKNNNIPDITTKWQLKNLSPDTVNIVKGVTYSKNKQVEKSNTIILTADNITLDGKFKISRQVFLNDNLNIEESKKLRRNDIFMCFSSGSKKHLGKVALIEEDTQYYAGGFMAILRVKEGINAKYLYYLLNGLLRQTIIQKGTGLGINNLSSVIDDIKIPHPPTDIQHQIVSEIEILEEKSKTIVVSDFDEEIEKILKKYLL
jgi:type I restriction enzyme M protein